jgi:hypothetical protein
MNTRNHGGHGDLEIKFVFLVVRRVPRAPDLDMAFIRARLFWWSFGPGIRS